MFIFPGNPHLHFRPPVMALQDDYFFLLHQTYWLEVGSLLALDCFLTLLGGSVDSLIAGSDAYAIGFSLELLAYYNNRLMPMLDLFDLVAGIILATWILLPESHSGATLLLMLWTLL